VHNLWLVRIMAAFKGVELFGEFAKDASTSKFPQWQIMVRMALKHHFPGSAKCISRSAQELKTEIDEEVAQAANAYDAGRIVVKTMRLTKMQLDIHSFFLLSPFARRFTDSDRDLRYGLACTSSTRYGCTAVERFSRMQVQVQERWLSCTRGALC
jgi:hypothetical protein